MKFQTLETFNRHLKESASRQLDSVFLFVLPCEYERQKEMKKICSLLQQKDPLMRMVSLSGLESTIDQIRMELNSLSLWSETTAIFCDNFDKVRHNHQLSSLCLDLYPSRYLILGSSAFKAVSEFYQKGKKAIVVLDLSDEKPWEKQRRIQAWIKEECQRQSKNLHPQAFAYFLETIELDLSLLTQELHKLFCYVGSKTHIELADVKAICCRSSQLTQWQLAEKMIWEKPIIFSKENLEQSFLFSFISQLRYQLQIGYQLADLIQKQIHLQDLSQYFPQLRPTQLQKYLQAIPKKSISFFKEGLKFLYDIELKLKSTSLEVGFLIDLFQAKLYENSNSSSKPS